MSVSPISLFGSLYTGYPAYPAAAATTGGFSAAYPEGGFFSLASGSSTFLASVLGGSIFMGTSGGTQTDPISVSSYFAQGYGFSDLNSAVSSYQSSLSQLVSAPVQVSSFDAQQALSGQSVSLSAGAYDAASTFAQDTSRLLNRLSNIAGTPGDSASGVAADLQVAIGSAISASYQINTGYNLPNSIGAYGFSATTPGAHVVDASAIGLTQSGNAVSFDSATLQSAYATDPFATTDLLNTVIATVNNVVGAIAGANGLANGQGSAGAATSAFFPPSVNPSGSSAYLAAADAYQLASIL